MRFFTHKLNLIERTKLLEGIFCQSLTFTNKLETPYTDVSASALSSYSRLNNGTIVYPPGELDYTFIRNTYLSPIRKNAEISLISIRAMAEQVASYIRSGTSVEPIFSQCTLLAVIDGVQYSQNNTDTGIISAQLQENATVTYHLVIRVAQPGTSSGPYNLTYDFSYIINAVADKYPTKPYTITSAINRILDLAEPLFARIGTREYTPRFTLNPVQAEKWNDVLLPETTMTQCTLREQLQHIGNYVHAQVRLGGYYNGTYYENMIFYDEYGQEEQSTLQGEPYVANVIKHSINEYNTQIDTNAENIVNTLDYADGVIYAPDSANFKTVRTESVNTRISESNCLIATEFPIYDVISLKCKAFNSDGSAITVDGKTEFDITPYVFEAHAYNNLSSFGGAYPFSKEYALYYTQGEKNIEGLFIKATNVLSAVISDYLASYSIVNILQAVAPRGVNDWKNYVTDNFPLLSFQVAYIPIYKTKYSHTDGYIIGQERNLPFTKIYNQSENAIEARFYGQNIKGVAERLGNKEATRTYYLGSINKVPKTGTKLDDYYISSVVTEYMQQSIRCTVGLTEKFNRLSQNVGINSTKRVYEVSERQATERNILLKEYICIGDSTSLPFKSSNFQRNVSSTLQMLSGLVAPNDTKRNMLTVVVNNYESRDFVTSATVKAPLVSSAFGNAMTFSWSMKDNYSAGEKVEYLDNGYWQTNVSYSNFYGRAKNTVFQLLENLKNQTKDDALTSSANYTTYGADIENTDYAYLLRKDSREALNFNLAIEYVTNRKDLILSPALASSNPWVSNAKSNETPKLYLFNRKINKYEKAVTSDDTPTSVVIQYMLIDDAISFMLPNTSFDAWAIAYAPTTKTMTVYDEETGENEEINITEGGEILIACNNGSDYYASKGNYTENLYVRAYSDKLKEYESV